MEIDLDKIEASIASLTEEQVRAQLTSIRTRQRVQQKKYHDPEKSKAYRQKKAAEIKLMVERAKALGIYDKILEEADDLADQKLAEVEAEKAA